MTGQTEFITDAEIYKRVILEITKKEGDRREFAKIEPKLTISLRLICARNLQEYTGFYKKYTEQPKIPKRFHDFTLRLLMRFSEIN